MQPIPWDYALILSVLTIVVPWRGTVRIRELLAHPTLGASERIAMYGSTIAFQWLAAILTAWRVLAREGGDPRLAAAVLGLSLPQPVTALVLGASLSLVLVCTQIASMRSLGRLPPGERGRLYEMAAKLMPQTRVELLPFFLLVCTVSFCEELLYRGFAFLAFLQLFHGSIAAAIVGSSAIFAIGHLYQGRRGIATTFVLGAILAGMRAVTGSLAPCILVHFVVDFTAGLTGPHSVLRAKSAEDPATAA